MNEPPELPLDPPPELLAAAKRLAQAVAEINALAGPYPASAIAEAFDPDNLATAAEAMDFAVTASADSMVKYLNERLRLMQESFEKVHGCSTDAYRFLTEPYFPDGHEPTGIERINSAAQALQLGLAI